MTSLGSNIRCVAALEHRAAIASLYTEVFGAKALHPTPDLDVFVLAGGGHVGVYYVEGAKALSPEQHEVAGTWIELVVEDVAATGAELERRGVRRLAYHDETRAYHQAPGGQVFRLADASGG